VKDTYDVFVSYSRTDLRHAEDIASFLQAQGLTIFFDRRDLSPGLPWIRALEQAVNAAKAAIILIGPHGFGNTQQYERELATYRQSLDPSFQIVPVILRGGEIDRPFNLMSIPTWIDFSQASKVSDAPAELEHLLTVLRGGPIVSAERARESICPYRGFDAFREEDSMFFFGRGTADDPESAIGELVRKVREHPFVMVVGRSGSGKSSLVFAGLLPVLRRDLDRCWNVLTLRPGSAPIEALAMAFSRADNEDSAKYAAKIGAEADQLRAGDPELPSRMIQQVLDRSEGKPDRLLLYIDQWEELYAHAPSRIDVTRFIDLLLDASQSAPVSVVATVRADFYDRLLSHRKIQALLPTRQVVLGPMSRADLESTIVGPAKMAGLRFDPPWLVSLILDEAGEDEGTLPILQYALKETWAMREGSVMTADSYARSGGVRESIRLTAERTFTNLSPTDQQTARKLFLRLVTIGEGGDDTRARAVIPNEPELRKIVDQFAGPQTRLLVTGRTQPRENAVQLTVEVAHEALIRTWPRLRQWIDANREMLRARAAILRAKSEWEQIGRRDDLLLPAGFQLERARALLADPGDMAIDDIKEFVYLSFEQEQAKRLAEEQRFHELERALARKGLRAEAARPEPKPRGSRIFISYRRSDSRHFAGRLFDYLKRAVNEEDIFFDVNTMPVGVNFKHKIMDVLSDSAVMLCIIGDAWFNRAWRLYPRWSVNFFSLVSDTVKMEIEIAFQLGVPILPILVDNAEMPNATLLPSSISEFSFLNAAKVREGRSFDADVEEILRKIEEYRMKGASRSISE
jgi:energy-coupling factor transporter ATP-binding protein EcfA2